MSQELLWVSKDLVETIRSLEEGKVSQEDIKKVFTDFKREIEDYTYDVEDAASMFRRQSQKVKEGLKQLVDEEVTLLQEFWEIQDNRRYEIQKKITSASENIESVRNQLLELKELTSSVDIYGLEKLIEMIEKIKYMSDADKELLSKVFSHGKYTNE